MRRLQHTTAALGLALGAAVACPAVAAAAPPQEVDEQVVDLVGALSPGDRDRVEDAVDTLAAEHGIVLHVVLVDGFDGLDGPVWSERTFERSGLGADDALLAVAVDERRYGYVEETDVTAERATQVAVDEVEPRLRDEDWAGAAVAAAQGYAEPSPAGGTSPWRAGLTYVGVSIAAVAGAVGLQTLGRRRSRAREVVDHRAGLADRLGPAREELADLVDEEAFVTTELGEQDATWLQARRGEAETLLDGAVAHLAAVPREVGLWPPTEGARSAWPTPSAAPAATWTGSGTT